MVHARAVMPRNQTPNSLSVSRHSGFHEVIAVSVSVVTCVTRRRAVGDSVKRVTVAADPGVAMFQTDLSEEPFNSTESVPPPAGCTASL